MNITNELLLEYNKHHNKEFNFHGFGDNNMMRKCSKSFTGWTHTVVNVSSEEDAGRGFEWKSEFNDKVEEIVNEYMKFLKTIRVEYKIREINKDFE
ncbi:MAG: hypothetical protein J6T74_01765 [Clostridia bacterium]|nr:hypothetical protein [Clostridia bacterium]